MARERLSACLLHAASYAAAVPGLCPATMPAASHIARSTGPAASGLFTRAVHFPLQYCVMPRYGPVSRTGLLGLLPNPDMAAV